jgi:hypothetical protein
MSHELRTPLNAVVGFSDAMRQELFGPVPPRYADYAASIHEAGGHLLDLINDVLDVSRIEADRYELSLERFDAREPVLAALALVRIQADDKGVELAARPVAALTFHWKSLRRQVRVRGSVEPVTPQEADDYFASRARESRIGAWASDQSRPLDDRQTLEAAVARETARFEDLDVPRPERWSGWRVTPQVVEFWRDRPFRLHDRLRFTRDGDAWLRQRLWP